MLAAAAGIIVFSSPSQAQTAPGDAEAPGAALRRQLTELAANPTSVTELIDTGRAALAVGDGEAALSFFTRASDLAPRDARVKAGLAAANAQAGRPETALTLFNEAVALGAPVGEIAGERGLAYDLLGQTARAQQDYTLALRSREDPEIRRRLALSLAISGQREAALRLLDDQIRQGDRAGNRARVMVLALSGDVRGATAAANQSLPAQAAQALTPFFSRLASLSPAQMASAANLGRAPASGLTRTARNTAAAADPGALAFAGGGSSPAASLRTRLPIAEAPSTSPRRRPGAVESAARSTLPAATTNQPRASQRVLASSTAPAARTRSFPGGPGSAMTAAASTLPSMPASFAQPHPHQPLLLAGAAAESATGGPPPGEQAESEPVELAGASSTEPRIPAADLSEAPDPALAGARADQPREVRTLPAPAPVQLALSQPPARPTQPAEEQPEPEQLDGAAANLAVWNRSAAPASLAPVATAPARTRPAFSDVAASVSSLPTETNPAPSSTRRRISTAPSTPSVTRRPRSEVVISATPSSARRPAPATPRARTTQPANPSRVWVQLGVSASRAGFTYEINRMRRAAPELLRDRTPHVAPIGSSSNRLLVGPFPTEAAARTFVNGLRQKNIPSLTWTSPAGTSVERLSTGR